MFVMLFVLTEILILLSGTYQSLVIALNHMPFHVATNLVAQLLVMAIAYLLVGPFDILGAGLAVLAAPVFLFIATMIFLHRSHGIRMPGSVAARSGWLLLCIVVTGITGAWFQGLAWESALLKAGIYLVVVGGFALLLTSGERQRIREIFDGWRAKWT